MKKSDPIKATYREKRWPWPGYWMTFNKPLSIQQVEFIKDCLDGNRFMSRMPGPRKAKVKWATDMDQGLWPCQQLLGGGGSGIYSNVDGMCNHPECNPANDDRPERRKP